VLLSVAGWSFAATAVLFAWAATRDVADGHTDERDTKMHTIDLIPNALRKGVDDRKGPVAEFAKIQQTA
jgi:hypothetical protein